MAQVARVAAPDIDYHLDFQFRAWGTIPEYAQWWAELDATQKEVFHLEWVGITESRLDRLRQWFEQGLLSTAQRDRYDKLLELVVRHRPVVQSLLDDDSA